MSGRRRLRSMPIRSSPDCLTAAARKRLLVRDLAEGCHRRVGTRAAPATREVDAKFADFGTAGDWEKLVENIPSAALGCDDALLTTR